MREPEASDWRLAWTSGEAPSPACHEELIRTMQGCLKVRGKRILEVGAGTGRDSVELAALGARAYAIDFALEALSLTRQLSEKHGGSVRLVCGDTLRLPFKAESFDLVFSQGLLEHFYDPLAVVVEQARLLSEGGYLLIDVPQKFSLYSIHKRRLMQSNAWFSKWEASYSFRELSKLLRSAGLKPVGSYGYGYYPRALLAVRNLHTIDVRRNLSLRLPGLVRDGMELIWQKLEAGRWFHRWLVNIGVVARKT